MRIFVCLMLMLAVPKVALAAPDKPSLQVHQGRYFRYSMPQGWQATETTNGVDMVAPDNRTGASFALLIGAFGQATPEGYISWLGTQLGYADLRIESVRPLPDQPGPGGFNWKVAEAQLRFTLGGKPVRANIVCGVLQGWGQYSVVTRAYQSPVGSWDRDRFWLPAVAESVVITNPQQVAGLDRVQLPRNIPHDEIYGDYNRAWQNRQVSADRISQAQREGTMGYERMKDPETGQMYDMPLEAYDPTRGGYRNPMRPTELLQKAAPGE